MLIKKNLLLVIFVIGLIFNFSACGGLKKTFGSSEYNKSYQEILNSFLSQNSGEGVILIGQKYNYSFSNAKDVEQLLKAQKLLNLNSSNFSLNMAIKEYKSSDVTLRIFSHFEESKLDQDQILWLEDHDYSLELRANFDGAKKSEPKPEQVPTYVKQITLEGKREAVKIYSNTERLNPSISLEVSEHISK